MQKLDPSQLAPAPAWTSVSYASGWSDYDTIEWFGWQYTKMATGEVIMRGLLKNVSGAAKTGTVTTLPAGFRPSRKLMFICIAAPGAMRVSVFPTGVIAYEGVTAIPANEWCSAATIRFLAEQ
jgi:hypothetical protein